MCHYHDEKTAQGSLRSPPLDVYRTKAARLGSYMQFPTLQGLPDSGASTLLLISGVGDKMSTDALLLPQLRVIERCPIIQGVTLSTERTILYLSQLRLICMPQSMAVGANMDSVSML